MHYQNMTLERIGYRFHMLHYKTNDNTKLMELHAPQTNESPQETELCSHRIYFMYNECRFSTDRSGQTVKTQIRPEEQS